MSRRSSTWCRRSSARPRGSSVHFPGGEAGIAKLRRVEGMVDRRLGTAHDEWLLRNAGAKVSYHDPHVMEFDGMSSVALEPEAHDCVCIVTAHSTIDYGALVERSKIVVDFRNATRGHEARGKVWKL